MALGVDKSTSGIFFVFVFCFWNVEGVYDSYTSVKVDMHPLETKLKSILRLSEIVEL